MDEDTDRLCLYSPRVTFVQGAIVYEMLCGQKW